MVTSTQKFDMYDFYIRYQLNLVHLVESTAVIVKLNKSLKLGPDSSIYKKYIP